jgi:beta-glucanase (GH16 family)
MSSRLYDSSLKLVLSGLVLPLVLQACGGVSSDVPEGEFVAPVVEWQLVFEDDFDGDTLDAAKWNIDEGDGCPDLCGWGNNELQSYSANNISVANGTLRIEGRQEADGSYTSGRLNTRGKFDFRYGRIEVNARIPSGQGTWPAIWMLHSDPTIYGPWPLSGEIDIMEAFNYGVSGNQSTQSTAHYGLPIPPFNGTSSKTDLSANADTSFHEYALEWERGRLRFFVDGTHFQTQIVDEYWVYYPAGEDGLYDPFGPYTLGLEDAPFDQAFHLLLNFAIGGNPVGDPDATTPFPQAMEVDYVRIYECANSNPESRRGCGTADASVEVLSDHDGGPLEGVNTAKPFVESQELFLDGPETVTIEIGDQTGTNTLAVDGFTGDGAVVVNNPAATDPDDPENTVWQVGISGGVANVFLASEDLTDDELLDTGFDFSGSDVVGGDPVGEVVFDMYVNSVSEDATILVKLDSGFPDVGEVVLPLSEIAVGTWKTYSIKFEDIVANPGFVECCGGEGVDLANVVNPFVFEVTSGSVDVLLDNIMVTNACYVVGACSAGPRTKGIPDLIVFDDAVNTAIWSRGIVGSDSGSGFTDYTDGLNPANKVNWSIIDDPDPLRGQVIDVTFNDSSEFGVWFIANASGVNMSAFAAGAVVFDIIVDDYGTNTTGMTMKVDCFFPCTSGDKNLGVIADGVWETVTVPVSTMTATGLDLTAVNTGIVVFPTDQNSVGTARFRLDNIRWVASTDALPKDQIDLPVTFDDPLVDYSVVDFEGASTSLVEDPTNSSNTVAQTVKGTGAQTFAGTVIGTDAGFASPIPFSAGETLMSVDVYSPAAGIPVMLKVENADASVGAEVIMNTTTSNTWETLTYDFSTVGIDTSVTFTKAIIFFDFGQDGVGDTYLWDNVRFGAGATLDPIDLPVTFDDPGVAYSFIDFNGTSTTVGEDPDNMNNRVGITVKGAGAETFAGTVVGDGTGFLNPIPFTATDTTMSLRVRAPAAGIPVRLKVEGAGGTPFAEMDVLTTAANTWETLTFDFSTVGIDTTGTYIQAVVFFDFGQVGNDATYYWDDLEFVPSAATEPLVVFDDTVNPIWDVGLAGTESPNFPLITDGTAGNVVNWSVVAAADTFRGNVIQATIGGTAPEFGLFFIQSSTGIDLNGYSGGSVVFDINVLDYGTNTNGMIMKIDCVFPCTSGDTPIGVVGDGHWETVSIPVSQLVGTGLSLDTVNTGIVVFPDVGDQQAGASVTFQIDNVRWEPDVLTNQNVFVNGVVDALWNVGIAGTESPNFPLITDGTAGNVVNWSVVASGDQGRGDVIEAIIGGAAPEFGLMFIQSAPGVDMSDFDQGAVVFDINVTDYGTNTNGMIMKIDCEFPCTSGDQPIGVVGAGGWETVSIEVSQLLAGGLSLATVNTGIVIFPDVADQQAGATVTFRIDNVHWEP